MNDRIEARLQKVDTYYEAASADTRAEADEIIPWSEIYRLGDDDHFIRYIREHVEKEHARRRRGDRTKPLCRCADRSCPVKRGNLPPQVVPRRGSIEGIDQDVEDRVDAFVNGDHPDLVIGEALEQWLERHAEILPKLTRAVGLLEDEVEGREGLLDA